jgi:hypothetical protein
MKKQRKSKYLTYSPYYYLSKDILKYLIPFKKLNRFSYPGFDEANTFKKWNIVLDKMILAFELIIKDDWSNVKMIEKNQKKIDEGLKLFSKYFQSLWD